MSKEFDERIAQWIFAGKRVISACEGREGTVTGVGSDDEGRSYVILRRGRTDVCRTTFDDGRAVTFSHLSDGKTIRIHDATRPSVPEHPHTTRMNGMETAPHDRPILLRLDHADRVDQFCVAQYAEWDGGTGPYARVWQTGPGECITMDTRELLGWYELPE